MVIKPLFLFSLPDIPMLRASSSAVNKDMMSKVRTNGDTIIWLSRKKWEKEKLLVTRNVSFSHYCFKSVCCWRVKMSIYKVKG